MTMTDFEKAARMAAHDVFLARVQGAVVAEARAVKTEQPTLVEGAPSMRNIRRATLADGILHDPGRSTLRFATVLALAPNLLTVYAPLLDVDPTDEPALQAALAAAVAELDDAAISAEVQDVWDVLAGVNPWDTGVAAD